MGSVWQRLVSHLRRFIQVISRGGVSSWSRRGNQMPNPFLSPLANPLSLSLRRHLRALRAASSRPPPLILSPARRNGDGGGREKALQWNPQRRRVVRRLEKVVRRLGLQISFLLPLLHLSSRSAADAPAAVLLPSQQMRPREEASKGDDAASLARPADSAPANSFSRLLKEVREVTKKLRRRLVFKL